MIMNQTNLFSRSALKAENTILELNLDALCVCIRALSTKTTFNISTSKQSVSIPSFALIFVFLLFHMISFVIFQINLWYN